MLIKARLAKIFELLNLEYYDDKGRLHIIDLKNNTSAYVEKDNNGNSMFTIGDIHCIFNDYLIEITVGNKKATILPNVLLYERKKDNSDDVVSSFRITNNTLCFLYNTYGINSTVELKYDKQYKYHGMKKTEHICDENGTSLEFISFFEMNNFAVAKYHIFPFDHKKKKKQPITYEKYLAKTLDDVINNEINSNWLILIVLNELNDMIPGIIDYYGSSNPIIRNIFNSHNNKK